MLNQAMMASNRAADGQQPIPDENDWRETLMKDTYQAWGHYIYHSRLRAELDRFVDDVPDRDTIENFYKKNVKNNRRLLEDIQDKIIKEHGPGCRVYDFREDRVVTEAELMEKLVTDPHGQKYGRAYRRSRDASP